MEKPALMQEITKLIQTQLPMELSIKKIFLKIYNDLALKINN